MTREELNAYMKTYHAKPENKVKAKIYDKEYRTRPEVKEKDKIRDSKPKRLAAHNARMKIYYAKHIVEIRVKKREIHLKKKYGLTEKEYNQMYNNQNGCCAVCGKHQSEFKRIFDVDHDHVTGKVRGLLCRSCNTGLGYYETKKDLFKIYLKQ